ncbi:unnamed protein product [Paramecium primaurelia]|uniref:Uncharacterized protein n=1 Tax=Paramecium primaurelia TaxID=5886 RepID=A0A8S1NX56_PARPR|nr:unnamed protein product [Paramecium primaurelia]
MQLSPIDIDYLHQESIGGVIADGLTVLYNTQPEKPIEFLAKWLLQYCKTSTQKTHFYDDLQKKEQNIQNFIQQQKQEKEKLEELLQFKQQTIQQELNYIEYLRNHPYHQELIIQEFPDFLMKKFNLSGVYICYFTHQKQEVDIDLVDDENAFINQKAPKLLKYVGTSSNQKFLLNLNLTEQAILTYEVLKPPPVEEGKAPEVYKGCYIPDVVKESKIYFHRFPKLGCYFAIPMNFETSLFEDAFDAGLMNRIKYNSEVETQKQEIKAKELEHAEQLQNAENEEQKQQLEDEYQNYLSSLPQIVEPSFLGIQQQYIVCGDTLGQDRKLSQEERNQLYDMIQQFGQSYQEKEIALLSEDINQQIEYHNTIPEKLEENYLDQENQFVEQQAVNLEELKQTNERDYNYEIECIKFDFLKQQFTAKDFASTFLNLTKRRVIKFPNIIKALFYLLGYKKEEITLENKLNWKIVASYIDYRFLAKLALINHRGPKEAPLQHATIFRLEKLIDIYDEEKVMNYNWALGYLQRFLTLYCKLRREDVAIRKEILQEKRVQLQAAKEQLAQLLEQKEIDLQTARTNFQGEEGEEFDEQKWIEQWESEHNLPEIGPEPQDEIDDDLE